ncbi:AI-2E family transporter, partial [Nostoc sp. NIES-2111]
TVLRASAEPLKRYAGLSDGVALAVAGLVLVVLLGGSAWLLQFQIKTQVVQALGSANDALPKLGAAVGYPDLPRQITDEFNRLSSDGSLLGRVTSFGAATVGAVTNLAIILFGGIYLAIDPRTYRRGLLNLFPKGSRDEAREALDASGRALRMWLLGQLVAMVVTGTMTGLALWLIGVPSAFGLGLIAGLLEFIPLLGPFLGAVPAVLTAFAVSPTLALWTILAFVAIQQVESNIIQPIVTRRYVSIPPALLLFAVVAAESLFGLAGVLLAAPLTVLAYVFVSKAYVRDTLGESTVVPGEDAGDRDQLEKRQTKD